MIGFGSVVIRSAHSLPHKTALMDFLNREKDRLATKNGAVPHALGKHPSSPSKTLSSSKAFRTRKKQTCHRTVCNDREELLTAAADGTEPGIRSNEQV